MTTRSLMTATAVLSLLSVQSVLAVVPNASEMAEARRWVAAKFEGLSDSQAVGADAAGLEVVANHDPVQVNCHNGKPLRIGDKEYTRGLYCHAPSKVVVHLPSPGKMFRAVAGVDRNPQTVGDVSTVVFSVSVGEKKAFESKVMRVATPGVAVETDLNGAKDFVLEVGDGGDGISCDQANWADARVTLVDGRTLWLADLPFVKSPAQVNALTTDPFFSFLYDGKPSAELLKAWKCSRAKKVIDAQKTEHTITYRDPKTGLEVRCIGTEFSDFPAVEWVIQLENKGKKDTPILESIQALDSVIPFANVGDPSLYWSKGGVATFDDFAPQEAVLKGDAKIHLQPGGGRSSNSVLPFFNVMNGCNGVISAVGWTGEWAADFVRVANGVEMKAGLARTHLSLHPGETIRTPRMLLVFFTPDRWRGQNLLRQFILSHHRPMQNGKPLVAPITWGNWGGTTAEVHLDNIQKIIDHKLPIDYYWVDAGWYGKVGDDPMGSWAPNAGTWTLRPDLYPQGFKALSDTLEKSGRHLMVWFEPERVVEGTLWSKEHPEWMLKVPNGGTHLMNLGNPKACKFVTDFISEKIKEFGLGCYRQDYNIDPLEFWKANDAENRQGMSEIRYIEGLYAFWDGLLSRFPHLMIDNCASGGRRIDLETTSRATPYWRTDGPRDPVAHQCHSYGLMAWVPLSAISEDREGDTYEFRSSMCSSLCVNWFHSGDGPQKKMPADFPFDWGKKILDEYLTIRDFYYGDYYPLTSYTQDRSAWLAWQFDRPELGDGMVQVFRRDASPYESLRVTLRGLDPDAVYTLTNLGVPGSKDVSGRELLEKGLAIAIEAKPGAVVITYQKKP
jgi:alpha-galactosidase